MSSKEKAIFKVVCISMILFVTATSVFGNGGPFVLKYPKGDPAAKGVLARIDPSLMPARETRLRVIKEDLEIKFGNNMGFIRGQEIPMVHVTAEYTIDNSEKQEIEIDFGFPILRGVFTNFHGMSLSPDFKVELDGNHVGAQLISNSAIYGIIRSRCREVIDGAIKKDPAIKSLVSSVRLTSGATRQSAKQALITYMTEQLKWEKRRVLLMAEYASLDLSKVKIHPPDRSIGFGWLDDENLSRSLNENLGILSAIGEQKATQFFAQLATGFDAEVASGYEKIFSAWGGDVRERSVDIETSKVRPREVSVEVSRENKGRYYGDPGVYARVDYLDPDAKITEEQKQSCRTILKNLDVVFTFAPMNILHYRVKFEPEKTCKLKVSYSQYAYADTSEPASYQLAYVVHPASLWNEFGPINLDVIVPEGVRVATSVPLGDNGVHNKPNGRHNPINLPYKMYRGQVKSKKGEIFIAVEKESWARFVKDSTPKPKPMRTEQEVRRSISKGKR